MRYVGSTKRVRVRHQNDVSPLHQMTEDRARPNAQKRYEIAEDVLRSNIKDNTLPQGVVLLMSTCAALKFALLGLTAAAALLALAARITGRRT